MARFKSVLLIDDDEDDIEINENIINHCGFTDQIYKCINGQQAIDFLLASGYGREGFIFPELIFVDIQMPMMDGFGFLKAYENLPQKFKKSQAIIMLTSSEDPNDIKLAKENEYLARYLVKPLTKNDLDSIDQENLKQCVEK